LHIQLRELSNRCRRLENDVEILNKQLKDSLTSADHLNDVFDANFPPNLSLVLFFSVR